MRKRSCSSVRARFLARRGPVGGEKGLFLSAAPAAAPGADGKNASRRAAMAWKRLFFDALWPSRFKWAADKKATKRDFKIEVCVRFRPEAAEENVAAGEADVTLPLHQYLAVQRQRRAEAPPVERHLVGGADVRVAFAVPRRRVAAVSLCCGKAAGPADAIGREIAAAVAVASRLEDAGVPKPAAASRLPDRRPPEPAA